ncbi:MAG: hypothetical protein WBH86_17100 [Thermogutta sp.]|nr:hypothetical protein [Thermogutta sp.]HOP76215.1 hypothetical protein [Thermogutta sp.]HPU07060.1 hypothetical protein [Thermogutta sp.]
MNGAKFDCSRKSRESHENNVVPIRVSAEAFRKFQESMKEYWEQVIAQHGSPRRLRIGQRIRRRSRKAPKAKR